MVVRNTADEEQLLSSSGKVGRLVGAIFLITWTGLADTPVTPNASPETQALLSYFHDVSGEKMLSGQQEGWRGTNELGFELRHIQETTGELPALLGLDAMSLTAGRQGRRAEGRSPVVSNAIDWYAKRNGIVTFC
jgi:hypothetical protein